MQVQPSAPGVYSIGQLSQLFNTTRRALRHYESKGLLKPTRDGPYRLYGQREFQRLTVIVEARQVGLGIDQIQKVLDAYDPEDRGEAQIIKALQLVRRRLAELDQKRDLAARSVVELEARLERARKSSPRRRTRSPACVEAVSESTETYKRTPRYGANPKIPGE